MIGIIISSSLVFAEDVAFRVEKGKPSPITGVVLTDTKVKELYRIEQREVVLNDLRLLDKELLSGYKQDNIRLHKNLETAKLDAFWSKVGFFVLGAIVYRGVSK